ncbi:MAG: hypothetical protein HY300_09615 [Verrucomicrobia bacterium]|nr:hypothetical protein [Verrucomicrobiota bacterium]
MKDEFTNRLGMFDTTLLNLNTTTHKAVWFQPPPLVFTAKVADATSALVDLRAFCGRQTTDITGAAVDKEREGKEAIAVAHTLGRALVTWFRDQADETNAAKVDLPESGWRRLRGEELLAKGRLARDLAQGVVSGPKAAQAVDYGITAEAVTSVNKEVEEYGAVISAPQASIADRKSLTQAMRDRFNAVEAKFAALDDMILQFGGTVAGRDLIASHQEARIIRDLGAGPGQPASPTPPPAPQP